MREKLSAIIPQYFHAGGNWGIEMGKLIDNILTLMSEEIEKVGISAEKCSCSDCFASGANKMKLAILSLLKE